MVLKKVIFNTFTFGREVVFKELFLLWKGEVVLKKDIFNSFSFGRVWWS